MNRTAATPNYQLPTSKETGFIPRGESREGISVYPLYLQFSRERIAWGLGVGSWELMMCIAKRANADSL
jgi:hypothetical protein